MKALSQEGLIVSHKSDFSWSLSAKGRIVAEQLVRAHRLWETFLVDKVGLNDHDIHDDAEKYEHLLNQDILDQLDIKLGFPTKDPHGSPIPHKIISAHKPLLRLKPKSKAKIASEQLNTEVEGKLWELGLQAHASFQILDIDQDKITIKTSSKNVSIPAELAEKINVY